ncbi:MAG: PIN domain-containing protein [Myxococcales bacterium]|nr:PIN domain-containing protein [Myxococcales bacterium]
MIAVDTNVLVAAHRADSPFHHAARRCVRGLAEGASPWAIPWPCLHEFYGIATHPRIWAPPSPPEAALAQIRAWTSSPSLALLTEGPRHLARLEPLLLGGRVVGPRVHDARIAALCLDHGVRELWTADRDFGRFPALVTRNPLVPA